MIIALYYHCATGECGGAGKERVIPLPRWRGEGEGDTPPGGAGKERGIPPPLPPCFSVKGFAEHTVLIKP